MPVIALILFFIIAGQCKLPAGELSSIFSCLDGLSSIYIKEVTYYGDGKFELDSAHESIESFINAKERKSYADNVGMSHYWYDNGKWRHQAGGIVGKPISIEVFDGENLKVFHSENKNIHIKPADSLTYFNAMSFIAKPFAIFNELAPIEEHNRHFLSPSIENIINLNIKDIKFEMTESKSVTINDIEYLCVVVQRIVPNKGKVVSYLSKKHSYMPVKTVHYNQNGNVNLEIEVIDVYNSKVIGTAESIYFPSEYVLKQYTEGQVLVKSYLTKLLITKVNKSQELDLFDIDYSMANRIIDEVNDVAIDLTK